MQGRTQGRVLQAVGFDLSLNATGVCLPDGTAYTINCKPSQGDARFTVIRDHIRLILRHSRPDLAVIEDLARFKGRTLIVMSMVRACAVLELLDSGVPYVFVSPAGLKQFATGNGRADKDDMMRAAADRGGKTFTDDNQCDAWWLRKAALCAYGYGAGMVLDDKQRSALETIGWPDVQRAGDAERGPQTATSP